MSEYSYQTLDPIKKWLATVAYSNSGSKNTERKYRKDFREFLTFIGKTANEILIEYEDLKTWNDNRLFQKRYVDCIQTWIISLQHKGLANSTIKNMIGTIQSFFKYNRISLGFIPTAKGHEEFHNRDIKREEIVDILNTSLVRDRAFYCVMAQSGLRPDTICKLKIRHIEYDKLLRGESPVKIDVPAGITKGKYHPYFTFIADESIQFLNSYLKKRTNIIKESYLFVKSVPKNETPAFT